MEPDELEKIGGLKEELLVKEEELNGTKNFLLGQDLDLRACLNRIGDLEKAMLANPPFQQSSDSNLTVSPASSQGRPQERIGGTRSRTLSSAALGASDNGGPGTKAKVVATSTTSDCLPPSSAHPLEPVEVDTTPSSSPTAMSRERRQQILSQQVDAAAYPIDHKVKETPAGKESIRQGKEVDLPQQQSGASSGGSWDTHSCPASITSLNTAALAASFARHACPPESPPQHAAKQRVEPVEEGVTGEKYDTSATRCFDQQVVHRREQYHIEEGSFQGSRRDDDSLSRAERRAEEAEAAKRLAEHEARVAKGEVERLRREGAELSAWRDAVLDIRDALEQAGKDGEGKSDSRDNVDDDPIARHRRWVYSSALGTLLPRLQHRAQELLSELEAAHARELLPAVSEAAPVRYAHHKKEEREQVAATSVASAVNEEGGGNEAGEMISSLRKECNTLRIIVRALREKDEESQRQITALQGEISEASRTAVRQDAMVSALRRRLDVRDLYKIGGTTRSSGGEDEIGNDEDVGDPSTCCGKPDRVGSMAMPTPTAPRFTRAYPRRGKEDIVDPSLQSSKPWPLSNGDWIENSALDKCHGSSEYHYCRSSSSEAPGNNMDQAQGCRSVARHVAEPSNDRRHDGYATCPNNDAGGRHSTELRCISPLGHMSDSRHGIVASTSRNGIEKRRGCRSFPKELDRQVNVDLRKKDEHVCNHIHIANEMEGSRSKRSEHRSQHRRGLFVNEARTPSSSGDCIREYRNLVIQSPGRTRRGKDSTKCRSRSLHGASHAKSGERHGTLKTSAMALAGNNGGVGASCAEGTSALNRGRRQQASSEDSLRQRLLQARKDLSALRNGVSVEELFV